MVWVPRLWLRLQTLFRLNRVGQRLNDEIQFHLDQQIAENIAAGDCRRGRCRLRRKLRNRRSVSSRTRSLCDDSAQAASFH